MSFNSVQVVPMPPEGPVRWYQVNYDGYAVGMVEKVSDHWVAQPSWNPLSASFLSASQAVMELVFHYWEAFHGPVPSC